jgi:hypothetical protein
MLQQMLLRDHELSMSGSKHFGDGARVLRLAAGTFDKADGEGAQWLARMPRNVETITAQDSTPPTCRDLSFSGLGVPVAQLARGSSNRSQKINSRGPEQYAKDLIWSTKRGEKESGF